jgi:3,4-dihydroxy 2-butanone 4-phosphate synthase / GTP cyclohydrolase II
MSFDPVEDAIQDIRDGKMVIVADDEDRENEGDLVCAASTITPDLVNFMAIHGRGLICVTLTPERADALDLKPMTDQNTDPTARRSPFPWTDMNASGSPPGSAPRTGPPPSASWRRRPHSHGTYAGPGHIFPLRAVPGGVLRRVGQTEASVDLARLAGLPPGGGDLRDPGLRRVHGPSTPVGELRPGARAQVHHRGAARGVSPPPGAAGPAGGHRPASHAPG